MKPSQISEIHQKIMRDYWFQQEYRTQIAQATIEYYLQIILLYGRWKKDPNIKKTNEQAEYIHELEKEGLEW